MRREVNGLEGIMSDINQRKKNSARSHSHVELENTHVHAENRWAVARGRQWLKWVKWQREQASRYQSWGCKVLHGDYSYQLCVSYLKVVKRVNLQSSHHKKKIVTLFGDRC